VLTAFAYGLFAIAGSTYSKIEDMILEIKRKRKKKDQLQIKIQSLEADIYNLKKSFELNRDYYEICENVVNLIRFAGRIKDIPEIQDMVIHTAFSVSSIAGMRKNSKDQTLFTRISIYYLEPLNKIFELYYSSGYLNKDKIKSTIKSINNMLDEYINGEEKKFTDSMDLGMQTIENLSKADIEMSRKGGAIDGKVL
jgi:hypothetical protein